MLRASFVKKIVTAKQKKTEAVTFHCDRCCCVLRR